MEICSVCFIGSIKCLSRLLWVRGGFWIFIWQRRWFKTYFGRMKMFGDVIKVCEDI